MFLRPKSTLWINLRVSKVDTVLERFLQYVTTFDKISPGLTSLQNAAYKSLDFSKSSHTTSYVLEQSRMTVMTLNSTKIKLG